MADDPNYALNTDTSPTSPFNSLDFAMKQAGDARMTGTIVQVKKVTTTGDVAAIGRVDVMPLVKMVDGVGRTIDHVTVYNLPYFRIVGGSKAVILDPKVGDIGFVVVADRDISAVKASKKASPPGSRRTNNIADGVFIGCFLADKPTSYVQFKDSGTIIVGVGPAASAAEAVIASTHVQIKKRGADTLHVTVDIANSQIILGQDYVVGPDPYPGD